MSTKVGIIGAGGMLPYHLEGIRRAGGQALAIADAVAAAAERAAAKHGIPQHFSDVGAMLAAVPELDAVSIIVPNKFHAPLAIQALQAGKHVFCEKPPALHATEMAAMIAARDQAGKHLMFNFNNRARPEAFALMDYIRNGTVGTIQSAQARWIRRTGIPGFGGWFTNKALSGGGALIDLPHMMDLALHFMGFPEPAWVLGQTFDTFIHDKTFKGPWGIPDVAHGVNDVETAVHGFVTFKTGQVLTLQISWAEMIQREEVSVNFQGTKAGGRIERLFGRDGIDATALDTCELYVQEGGRSVNRTILTEPCEDMGRIRSMMNFIAAIEGREEPLNTPAQSLILMKIIDGLYASARSGAPVAL